MESRALIGRECTCGKAGKRIAAVFRFCSSVLLYGYYAVRKDIRGSEINIKEEPTPKRMVKIAKHGGFLMKILMNFCFLKR